MRSPPADSRAGSEGRYSPTPAAGRSRPGRASGTPRPPRHPGSSCRPSRSPTSSPSTTFRNRTRSSRARSASPAVRDSPGGGRRDAASRRSSVSSRRLWGAHSSVVADSHDQRSRRDYRNRGQRHRRLAAVGTIALRQCDRRAGGAVRGRRTAEFGRLRERRSAASLSPAVAFVRRLRLGIGGGRTAFSV